MFIIWRATYRYEDAIWMLSIVVGMWDRNRTEYVNFHRSNVAISRYSHYVKLTDKS